MEDEKHRPMRDNPAFAQANKDRRFGAPNGNPIGNQKAAVHQREFYRWVESIASEDELKAYIKDTTKPYMRRLYVQKAVKAKTMHDIHELTNQVHGLPKQVLEMAEPPKIEINIGKDGVEGQ